MMDKTLSRYLDAFSVLLFALVLVMGSVSPATAESGKLFFTAIVERNDVNKPQVVLEWGALEGEIPAEIVSFNLYRSTDGGNHVHIKEIPYQLVDASVLQTFINNDLIFRTEDLVTTLNRMSESGEGISIDRSAAGKYLHSLLDPGSSGYDPFNVMLLSRAHLTAARAQGLAFIDDALAGVTSCQYMLTAVTAAGESLPIGQTDKVNPAVETVLPAPTGLDQVRLGACSALGAGLDDNKINLVWDVPTAPQDLGLKAVTYGYDLFWSATNLGVVNFRTGIPASLNRVNPEPVVVAGPPPTEGPDSFLAKDGPENHASGPVWQRGQSYFYYLAAKDIAGHYSAPSAPVELFVTDAMPPRGVWNAHTMEIKDPADNSTPRLALVWDAPTATNFTRYYGGNRNICSGDAAEVCWVSSDESCATDTPRCADLAVDHYRVFRFNSPQEAADWGVDTDGDLWPDNMEIDELNPANSTDPCDSADHPAGTPPAWIINISPDDTPFIRNLTETHQQIFYIDYDITDDNKVYWYRVIAVDAQGNQSPLSGPLRGVLYDRSQPLPAADIASQSCDYHIDRQGDCSTQPEADDVLVLRDETGDAASYKFFQQCGDNQGNRWQLLDSGPLTGGVARIKEGKLPGLAKCTIPRCVGSLGFVVRFYDANGEILSSTDPFQIESICAFNGCVILKKDCRWTQIGDPYAVVDEPIQACVDLKVGQSARFYYQTSDGMSPFHTIPAATVTGKVCVNFDDLAGLTPADICLGVRVFSQNHVGSIMRYLGCMELHDKDSQPPPTPLLDPIESDRDNLLGPFFALHWSVPDAGVGSFILKITDESGVSYKSLWNLQRDDAGGYTYSHFLLSSDPDQESCFQVRALSTDMLASGWSLPQCGTWEEAAPENLGWPPVAEPADGGSLGAFYMATGDDKRPVLVLSDNLTSEVDRLNRCSYAVPLCEQKTNGTPCLRDTRFEFFECPACAIVRAKIPAQDFIVYRQESGRDFVQVSPLIEGFHCRTENHGEIIDVLHDPFITLINVDQATVTGVNDPAGIGAGVRILFKDRYPFKGKTQIRYKLVSMNHETGEPEIIFTSNWVDVP